MAQQNITVLVSIKNHAKLKKIKHQLELNSLDDVIEYLIANEE